ncbi:hypothetical protein AAG747_04010 [Rapidithrix thailandica]|uniref:Lipoprotein n=1 Tax=Rapidithrix thailandica TaxID=413964 RepID=A0AAW9S8J1_9BACT
MNFKTHRIFLLILSIVLLTQCAPEGQHAHQADNTESVANRQVKEAALNITQQEQDFSFIDTLNPLPLPIGKQLLIEFDFAPRWDFGAPDQLDQNTTQAQKNLDALLGNTEVSEPKTYQAPTAKNKSLNFFLSEKDYRTLYFDTHQYFDYDLFRLQDVNDSVKVLGLTFFKDEIDTDTEFPFSVSYYEILTVKNNNIVDRLTLDRFEGNYAIGGTYRLFYIGPDYIIHTKDFHHGENQGEFIRYEKWQIKANGHIVHYFDSESTRIDKQDGAGKVSEHYKQGEWIEIKPSEPLALQQQQWGLENTYALAIGSYDRGERTGEWKFHEYKEGKKGKLLYTETYQNGAVQERVFIKN